MTRALGIAFVIGAVLASAIVGLIFVIPRTSNQRRPSTPVAPQATSSARVRVLAIETAERAILMKERFSDERRAEFTDRALCRALGAVEGAWRFVEVWVVNRGTDPVQSLGAAPTVTGKDGVAVELRSLRAIVASSHTALAEMLVSELSPDPGRPLRKAGFRSTVYAMPQSVAFRDAAAAEVDGLRLVPHETTIEALETFAERPRLDLIAALAFEEPETRNRPPVMTEESR